MLLFALVLLSSAARADVWQIDIDGAIGPATADHVVRGLEQAEKAHAELVILRIDTPGGLDLSMRLMIKQILAANIPVVGYVSPGGARAASAGTYLLYATHIAVMASGTNLGAATPVQIGSPGLPKIPTDDDSGESGGPLESGSTAMERKIINDAVAYIQSLAQLRERNIEWAEKAVRLGASLSAEDALSNGVIDEIAESTEELLSKIDGWEIEVNGHQIALDTQGLSIHRHETDWRSEFLGVITSPNIAYILLLIGIYGLIIEFYNPGIGVPGVVGAVCLLLAMYALQVLPISYAGLGLILLGIALMTAEAFAPSFGILGLGGITAFIVGSIMLMDTRLPAYQIAVPMIIAFALFSAALLIIALGMVLSVRKRAIVSGLDHLLGARATVESIDGGVAWVRLDGELWEAVCADRLNADDSIRVDNVQDLTLHVSKL